MLYSAKSTANLRDFASSNATAVRNFSSTPPLMIVSPSGREKKVLSTSTESYSNSMTPRSHSPHSFNSTTPNTNTNANTSVDNASPNESTLFVNSPRQQQQSSLTPRSNGDLTPRTGALSPTAVSSTQLSPSREPVPLPEKEEEVLSIENHIGRPVIVWWTADKTVDVTLIQATDYTRVREWQNTYPRVVPKNQVAAFPVKSFSRETQETDTKLSFYIQTEHPSKPIHGLAWNAVETHIRSASFITVSFVCWFFFVYFTFFLLIFIHINFVFAQIICLFRIYFSSC
jgi:hypothetical protein